MVSIGMCIVGACNEVSSNNPLKYVDPDGLKERGFWKELFDIFIVEGKCGFGVGLSASLGALASGEVVIDLGSEVDSNQRGLFDQIEVSGGVSVGKLGVAGLKISGGTTKEAPKFRTGKGVIGNIWNPYNGKWDASGFAGVFLGGVTYGVGTDGKLKREWAIAGQVLLGLKLVIDIDEFFDFLAWLNED
ncbi:MAG: hypothetical protein JXR78_19200 [Victivallales bacterium]|nr:hypothetical protein [Victivallales bacterium]